MVSHSSASTESASSNDTVRPFNALQVAILEKVVKYINKDKKGGKPGAPKPEELIFDTVERSSSIPLPSGSDDDE